VDLLYNKLYNKSTVYENKAFEKKKADYWKTRLDYSGGDPDPRRLWRHVDNVR